MKDQVPSEASLAQLRLDVALETTPKKAFATAVDWPGLSRSGRTREIALEAAQACLPRYAAVLARIDPGLAPPSRVVAAFRAGRADLNIIEEGVGGAGTEFGVPSRVTAADRRGASADDANRLAEIVAAAWTTFDAVVASAPAELRKGPRGGGRDRDRIVGHVTESDHAYAREIGVRLKAPAPGDRAAIQAMRAAILDVLRRPSDGAPLADRRWTTRYAAHRVAWHALDHAWEIEDRTEPAAG